jgi:formylglycine-generating enzyme required for sulfatase activity
MNKNSFIIVLVIILLGMVKGQERGVALVIGNQNYENMTKLTKAHKDAEEMGKKLEELGWEVYLKKDVTRKELREGVREIKEKLRVKKGIGIFYYSGHGIQVGGITYLVPVGADVKSEEEVSDEMVKVKSVLEAMEGSKNKGNVMFLDMCRSNELRIKGDEEVSKIETKGESIIVYATGEGESAQEGVSRDKNSVFTEALLKEIGKEGQEIVKMIKEVRKRVKVKTNGKQLVYTDGLFEEDLYLGGKTGGSSTEGSEVGEGKKGLARTYIKRAKGLLESGELEEMKKGLKLLEKALEADKGNKEAEGLKRVYEEAIKEIEKVEGAVLQETRPSEWEETLWGVCWKGSYVDFTEGEWERLGSAKQRELAGEYQKWYAKRDNGGEYEKEFRVGGTEIEMVLIPPGKYWRGSGESEVGRSSDEARHKVLISKGYWCGKYEVTQGQWKGVMGSEPSYFKGSSTLPVEQVSWEESKIFCEKTGMKLLSEAQWEYACRGGTTTPFSFGENINTGQVNYDGDHPYKNGEKGTDRQKTMEVGSFPANGWGLYEMHGNVWEWCEDWYAEKYPSGEVKDPVNTTTASSRVYWGGGWSYYAWRCRSSIRDWRSAGLRISNLGFRVSRSCP